MPPPRRRTEDGQSPAPSSSSSSQTPPRYVVPPAMEPAIQEFLEGDPSGLPEGAIPRNEYAPFNGEDAATEDEWQDYQETVKPNDAFVQPRNRGPIQDLAPPRAWPEEGRRWADVGPRFLDEGNAPSPNPMPQQAVPRNEVKRPDAKEEVDAEEVDATPNTVRRGTVNTARPIIEGDVLEQMLQPYAHRMQGPRPQMPESANPPVDTETRDFNLQQQIEREFMGPWARHRQTVVR